MGLLVLTRRIGESIHIGPDVVVTVTQIRGNQVSIGVDAPRHITVNREEVAERIGKEQEQASGK